MKLEKQKEILDLYVLIMEEVKGRMAFINYVLLGGMHEFPGIAKKEFMYLQLRYLCELTALGCLTAHGDIAESARLKGEWSAQKIIGALEKLNPDFFPQPVGMMSRTTGQIHFDEPTQGQFTKNELLQMYGKTGDVLHRGNFKKLLKANNPTQNSFPEISSYLGKFSLLLANHRISLLDGNFQLVCLLGPVNVAVSAVMAAKQETGPDNFDRQSA